MGNQEPYDRSCVHGEWIKGLNSYHDYCGRRGAFRKKELQATTSWAAPEDRPDDRQSSCLPLVIGLLCIGISIGVAVAGLVAAFYLWRLQ